jgi:hypothetical protein
MADLSEEAMWAEAHRLADSGECSSAFYIEARLRAMGFPDIEKISKNNSVRDELTKRCVRAKKDKAVARESGPSRG